MRLFVAGDTHGNTDWLTDYLMPAALTAQADKMLILGDFGYWEHTEPGVAFLDAVDQLAFDADIPLLWLPGNHDKTSLALEKYGHDRDAQGFIRCRPNVLLIPNGLAWSWQGVDMRSFGGAWSVDKDLRLALERRQGRPEGSLWFPEEQMSDCDMDDLLEADAGAKQIVFSHDKPLSSRPDWNRKDFTGCIPNQKRLDRALITHRPTYWLHGHLHYFYQDTIAATGTRVIGLTPDVDAAEPGWTATHSWLTLDLAEGKVELTFGHDH